MTRLDDGDLVAIMMDILGDEDVLDQKNMDIFRLENCSFYY